MTDTADITSAAPGLDAFSSAGAMLEALRARRVSAVELLDLHLRRIERYNPVLNAIVTPNLDDARSAARAADETRARGEERPLLGLPITIKDCINVAGLPGTAGAPQCAGRYPERDAKVTERLREAGAVILGKTNVPPWASDWQSDNPLFGRTNNPWDLERTPGGSTGGGAAALAAGLTPLEFGSDSGGSIRVPAAFCGVYGHKPSENAVPRSGHFPGNPLPNPAITMGIQGPLARCAEDLERALDAIAGPEIGEETAWRLAIPAARHEVLADFRVALLPPPDWLPVDAEIVGAFNRLADDFCRRGLRTRMTQPAVFGDLREYYKLALHLFAAIDSAGWPEANRREEAAKVRMSGSEWGFAWARGLEASASDYIMWHYQREAYRESCRTFFEEWDVLLAPITLTPAFRHMKEAEEGRSLIVNGKPVDYRLQLVYPCIANLNGQPSTAFPFGFSSKGLPVGLQVIGPYLEDRTPIRFAGLLAREFGGFRRPPGYE